MVDEITKEVDVRLAEKRADMVFVDNADREVSI